MITAERTARATAATELRPEQAAYDGSPEAEGPLDTRHPESSTPGILSRWWRAPLAAHAAVAAGLMGIFGALLGTTTAFTDDEGNVMTQARAIEHGHWALPSTFPAVDPAGKAFPMANVTLTPHGVAPLAKHLLYTSGISGIDRAAGPAGVLALSIVATVVAGLAAARLGRRHGFDLERISFWVTILATPLFFYSFVLTGQTVGAAAVGLSAVGTVAYLKSGRLVPLLGIAASMAVAVAAREEALIWCGAACVGLLAVGRWRRPWTGYPIPRVVVAAGVTTGAGLGARYTDIMLSRHLVGRAVGFSQASSTLLGGNRLGNQIRGAYIAIAGAGQGTDALSRHHLLVFVLTMAGLAASGACVRMLIIRHRPGPGAVLAAVAAACFVVRWAIEPNAVVAGLLAASPLVWAGLWLAAARPVRGPLARWTVVTGALFAAGVAASVYADGGGLQWGGRYFAVALPVVVPLLARCAQEVARALQPATVRRVLAAAVGAVALAGVAQPAAALVTGHRASAEMLTGLASAGRQARPADGGKPVVITTFPAIGVIWSAEDRYRMLLARDADALTRLGDRLRSAHIDRLVLITDSPRADERAVGAGYRVTSLIPSSPGWVSAVLVADPGPSGSPR